MIEKTSKIYLLFPTMDREGAETKVRRWAGKLEGNPEFYLKTIPSTTLYYGDKYISCLDNPPDVLEEMASAFQPPWRIGETQYSWRSSYSTLKLDFLPDNTNLSMNMSPYSIKYLPQFILEREDIKDMSEDVPYFALTVTATYHENPQGSHKALVLQIMAFLEKALKGSKAVSSTMLCQERITKVCEEASDD